MKTIYGKRPKIYELTIESWSGRKKKIHVWATSLGNAYYSAPASEMRNAFDVKAKLIKRI